MFPTITGRPIKIAVVGCGRISKNHFGSIEKHAENLKLVAVCDENPRVLAEHVEKYHVPGYENYETMLRESDCDLVAI